jgi:hypothetical protein
MSALCAQGTAGVDVKQRFPIASEDVAVGRIAVIVYRHTNGKIEQKRSLPRRGEWVTRLAGTVFSFCKKPDDLGERGAILPEKLMATLEHEQGSSWDSSHHALL